MRTALHIAGFGSLESDALDVVFRQIPGSTPTPSSGCPSSYLADAYCAPGGACVTFCRPKAPAGSVVLGEGVACAPGNVAVPVQMGCSSCGHYCVAANSGGWSFQGYLGPAQMKRQASLGSLMLVGAALGLAAVALRAKRD